MEIEQRLNSDKFTRLLVLRVGLSQRQLLRRLFPLQLTDGLNNLLGSVQSCGQKNRHRKLKETRRNRLEIKEQNKK